MKELQREHVLAAISRINSGEDGGFAESTGYDLIFRNRPYPPKRVIGIALQELSGRRFTPYDFKGGAVSACFTALGCLGFDVVNKRGEPYVPRNHKYGKRSWEWVYQAVKELGRVTKGDISAYIVERVPGFVLSNVGPDLQYLCVNNKSRGNYGPNTKPRLSNSGSEFDLLYQEGSGKLSTFVLYDPAIHGVWELAKVRGDTKLRPRLVSGSSSLELAQALADAEEEDDDFDPNDEEDARDRIVRSIVARRGQERFRSKLLKAYGWKCAITGFDFPDALEAAHIKPYNGTKTNSVRNGLLLRADLHTLFDLGLFRICPHTLKVVLAHELRRTRYGVELAKLTLRAPDDPKLRPDSIALRNHGEQSRAANAI